MAEEKVAEEYAPFNKFVNPLLTDLYQITMTYAYWKNGHQDQPSVFDLFFRKCPFKGEFCIFAGLEDVLRFISSFKFTAEQLKQLAGKFPDWDDKFWAYLGGLDCTKLRILAQREGAVVFPKVPLLRVEGPLALCQLVETTLLNLVNYPSLVCTNAARIRYAVGNEVTLLEFGLRRAQGPDGGMSASRYAYMGGFNGTSNVLAGVTFDVPIKGTHAHSFVSSYRSLEDLTFENAAIKCPKGSFKDRCLFYRAELQQGVTTNEGELAAFIAYAQAFPKGFLALIDTYSTLESGVINFLAVSLALDEAGLKPIGVRLDSGDLAYLSKQCRKKFEEVGAKYGKPYFGKLTIVASNDINEEVLYSLQRDGHEIDAFGIGTHLVTCKRQPALGCVYKLVEINSVARIKVSQDVAKMTVPGRKLAYRLWGQSGPLLDIMILEQDQQGRQRGVSVVAKGSKIRCAHPFLFSKRCDVVPSEVEPLLNEVWADGKVTRPERTLEEMRTFCMDQVSKFRDDYKRFSNPTPYKVSVSPELKTAIEELWASEVPVEELR